MFVNCHLLIDWQILVSSKMKAYLIEVEAEAAAASAIKETG